MLFALGRIDRNEDMSVLLIGDARAASVDVACSRPSDFCSFGKHVSSDWVSVTWAQSIGRVVALGKWV